MVEDVGAISGILRGASTAMGRVRERIACIAPGPLRSLLVLGETGVGKDLVPSALLACAGSRWRHVEVFNCPAVPADHLESELFGTMRGAFPGAVARPGALERAAGGLLFLDEVASLALHHQPKVLRMLDTGEGRRLGARNGYRVDVPVLAATREDLAVQVQRGRFREDLYYRLVQDGVLRIPPLRERPEDIPELVRHFQQEIGLAAPYTSRALALLQDQPWPGNVRQLRAVVRCVARLGAGAAVGAELVREALAEIALPAAPGPAERPRGGPDDFRLLPRERQRRLLTHALDRAEGNLSQAGVLLGFHRPTRGRASGDAAAARKLAHRKFRYWWLRAGLEAPPASGVSLVSRATARHIDESSTNPRH
jgi:two-component system NtrC family response regulator